MKTLIKRAQAKFRGRKGARAHEDITSGVFETRDALFAAADDMTAEIQANDEHISSIAERSRTLRQRRRHAQIVAARIHEFFQP